MAIKDPRKLIEVALPLSAINVASAREKSIRHGHPSTLHLWWARRPLATARAVLFAQMVNDPGGEQGDHAGKTKVQADAEREALFKIMRELVLWENTNNEEVLNKARAAIRKSWRETCELNKGQPGFDPEVLPAFHDPFAGGGSIPLEAQRLGMEAHASDLNPVAVLINKAMIEIPPKFSGRKPVGPIPEGEQVRMESDWPGATGLAEDVRRYGHWMREEAFKRIGHLYPQVSITAEMVRDRPDLRGMEGQKLTVIAWLWARTVKSPNPAFSHVDVPLASTFVLSTKKGKEAFVEAVVDSGSYRFRVKVGKPENFEKTKSGTKSGGSGSQFLCLLSGSPMDFKYLRAEAKQGRMGQRLMAIVAEGVRGRVYLSPTQEQERTAEGATPKWKPETPLPDRALGFRVQEYGMLKWSDIFTLRQLVALTTFSDLVLEARVKIVADAGVSGMTDDGQGLDSNGTGATAYGDAVSVYLAMAVDYAANYWSVIATPADGFIRGTFARQALPMTWDYAEAHPFGETSGNWLGGIEWSAKVLKMFSEGCSGSAVQADASNQKISYGRVVSTDPPYYDNIGYADLSDFFYVWLRRSLRAIYPELFVTVAVPKALELIASPSRHGSKEKAELFFLSGMSQAIHNLAEQVHPGYPVTIYYAFKQSETKETGTASTGWVTFLEAVIQSGFGITGTWPMRTERGARSVGIGTNSLASSIVLVCRKREKNMGTISRRDFQRELRETMPQSLEIMIGSKQGASLVAPVDLAQAAIGPGMGVYSKYAAVLNHDGSPLSVHEALIFINREITDFLTPDSGNFDGDTLFCTTWFAQYGWKAGPFGEAETLSRAKGTSVDGVDKARVIESGGGKVRLLKWEEYPRGWHPTKDERISAWRVLHSMIQALNQEGEAESGRLLACVPDHSEAIRQLAYHLYTLCERKKWADDALVYNELITSWHGVAAASCQVGRVGIQTTMDFGS